jgi:hypothetical protein
MMKLLNEASKPTPTHTRPSWPTQAYLLLFVSAILLNVGCSAEKKTFVSRNYHTMVSLFNGYYNAKVSYKEGVNKLEKDIKIPDKGFIPVVMKGGGSNANFTRANEKCDVIIFRHKNGRYVDNSYVLKGKSNFYLGQYFESIVNFEYVANNFPKSDLTKEELKLWIGKSYFVTDNMYRAKEAVRDLTLKRDLIEPHLRPDVAELEAGVFIKENQYAEAAKTLVKNLDYVKSKPRRARWLYLIAQLNEKMNRNEDARIFYEKAEKINASNEMNFKSRLAIAQLYVNESASRSSNFDEITKPLLKLLKDEKYDDYKDQIYYQFAKIQEKNKKTKEALGWYKKSLAASSGREELKTLSYYAVGKIYFYQMQKFDSAQAYFDSASTIVKEDNEDYYTIKTISKTLDRYSICKSVIKVQDSLLALSGLTDEALMKKVEERLEQEAKWKKEAEEKQKRQEQEQMSKMAQGMMNRMMGTDQQLNMVASGFYFDNPTLVNQGKLEFQKLWGKRKNEDDWRRKNKSTFGAFSEEEEESGDDKDKDTTRDGKKKKYFAAVPRSAEAKLKSNNKIQGSLMELAQLYYPKLSMLDSANYTYNELIRRYPQSENAPKAYYAIYTANMDEKSFGKAQEAKQAILDKYPKTIYARLVNNENLGQVTSESAMAFTKGYAKLVKMYEGGDCREAIPQAYSLINQHIRNPEIDKVFYIKGYCQGKMNQMDSLKATYQFIKTNFPESEVAKAADKTLIAINRKELIDKGLAKAEDFEEKKANAETPDKKPVTVPGFKMPKATDKFVVVLLIEMKKVRKDELSTEVSDFNFQHYKNDNLRSQVFRYATEEGKEYHLAYVSQFTNSQAADVYLNDLLLKNNMLRGLLNDPIQDAMFITPSSFQLALSDKRFHEYAKFFAANRQQIIKLE